MNEPFTPEQIEVYLSAQGWAELERGRAASLWKDAGTDTSVVVPQILDAPDYMKRVGILIDTLSAQEKSDRESLLTDIGLVYFDVVPFSVEPAESFSGSVPLQAGVDFYNAVRRNVVSAAAATIRRASSYGRAIPKAAPSHAKKVHLGQTERGSYVVPVLSRASFGPVEVPKVPSDRLDLDVEESLFDRRVLVTLARSLETVHEIVVSSSKEPTANTLFDAVREGVSRDLCLGILQSISSDDVGSMRVRFQWSVASPAPARTPDVEFPKESHAAISRLADRLEKLDPPSEQVLYGAITRLTHEPGEPEGRVGMQTMIGRKQRTIWMTLDQEQYRIARECHDQRMVIVRGKLHRARGGGLELETSYIGPDQSLFSDELT